LPERFGPHKSAWDRLGPDKFFSSRENGVKSRFSVVVCGTGGAIGCGVLSRVRDRIRPVENSPTAERLAQFKATVKPI
jgi:hypothetical protein